MRTRAALLFVAVALCSARHDRVSAQAQTITVRVLTYNVHHHLTSSDASVAASTYATLIIDQNADIVGLNESSFDKAEAVRAALQQQSGVTWYKRVAEETDTGVHHDVVLSKYPITRMSNIGLFWDKDCWLQHRAAIQATIDVNGHPLQVFVTHLSLHAGYGGGTVGVCSTSVVSPQEREVTEVIDFAQAYPAPRIIVGDFNMMSGRNTAETREYNALTANYTDSFREKNPTAAGLTADTTSPSKRIDYIFYTKSTGVFTASTSEVITSATYSDHYPVITEFSWNGQTWNNPPGGLPAGTGTIDREVWTNITGSTINDLLVGTSNFAAPPTSRQALTEFLRGPFFQEPDNWETQGKITRDNYGTRIRGFVTAPRTGDYTFWIASDNDSELWLSTDETVGHASRIAWLAGVTTVAAEWDKGETNASAASQKSAAVPLVSNRRYFMEVRHKEGTSKDSLAVGWLIPDTAPLYERPIQAWHLSPWVIGNGSPVVNSVTATPASPTINQTVTFTVSASDPESDSLTYNWDFDDGQRLVTTDPSVPHIYAAARTYIATVVVTDGKGGEGSGQRDVVVTGTGGGACSTTGAGVLLTDTFDDNSICSAWSPGVPLTGTTVDPTVLVTETNQRLEIGPLNQNPTGSSYNGMRSTATTYNFTGASMSVQLIQAPATGTTDAWALVAVGKDANNYYRWEIGQGNITALKRMAAGAKQPLHTEAYVAANHQFLRIKHSGTSVIFETAPNSNGSPGQWTPFYSEAWDTTNLPLTAVAFELKAGSTNAQPVPPDKVVFDNFSATQP